MVRVKYLGGEGAELYHGPTYTAYAGHELELDDDEAERVLAAFPSRFVRVSAEPMPKGMKAPVTKPARGMTK